MEKSEDKLTQLMKEIKELKLLEFSPAKEEAEPFENKYEARRKYKSLLEEEEKLKQLSDSDLNFLKAIVQTNLARNHFDTDQNYEAKTNCKETFECLKKVESLEQLFYSVNSIIYCLNNLGYHSVLGERFYEGVYYLGAAERLYWILKENVFVANQSTSQNPLKTFLTQGQFTKEGIEQIGDFIKNNLIKRLDSNLDTIDLLVNNPESENTPSSILQAILGQVPKFLSEITKGGEVLIDSDNLFFTFDEIEENYIQTVFFLAQVYAKLAEKDLAAEYCGKTLQRQYFKYASDKKNLKENELIVRSFDYKDFCNNSMGLSMYYSDKLMFKQATELIDLGEHLLNDNIEEHNLLKGSLNHMRGNIIRDFFMHIGQMIRLDYTNRQICN